MTKLTQTGSHASQQFSGSLCQELSKKLCEIVGIESKNSSCCSCEYFDIESGFCSYEVDEDGYGCKQLYPDFGQPENFVKLLNIMTKIPYNPGDKEDCRGYIQIGQDECIWSNGFYDFVDDCYATNTEFSGESLIDCVCNSLSLSNCVNLYDDRKLKREDCVFPDCYDELVEDVEMLKQAIREAEWKYE